MSILRIAGKEKKNNAYFQESNRLFEKSNVFFKHHDDENWYKQIVLRHAELYVKSNQIKKADSILGIYEDSTELALLNEIQKIMFFRINSEKYVKVKNLNHSLKNFKAAVTLSFKDDLKHEQLDRFIKL